MNISDKLLKELPKVELHCHLDGSLRIETILELAQKNNLDLHSFNRDALKKQLDESTRKEISLPKSDEDIEAWAKDYPDVAAIVETIL